MKEVRDQRRDSVELKPVMAGYGKSPGGFARTITLLAYSKRKRRRFVFARSLPS